MFQPFRLGRGWSWSTGSSSPRWTCTRATDGMPNDFHLVHLGGKALGGAGPGDDRDGLRLRRPAGSPRAAPASGPTSRRDGLAAASPTSCTRESAAKVGIQLGHSGRKGSTKLMWEGIDQPLDDGNWEVVAPSPLPYRARRQPGAPRARPTRSSPRSRSSSSTPPGAPTRPASTCSSCTARTATCCPSFISPVTNRRTDEYGGDLAGRLRYPLEVFARDARGLAGRRSR